MTGDSAEPGRIVGIAVRTVKNGPMRELSEASVRQGQGIEGDLKVSRRRGLTLLSREQWNDTTAELGQPLPWWTRRANLLVEGLPLAALIGRPVTIGEVRLLVHAETEPCEVMDEQYLGLRQALTPDCRGGVYGEVLSGGTIRIGDSVVAEA